LISGNKKVKREMMLRVQLKETSQIKEYWSKDKYKTAQVENKTLNFKPARSLIIRRYVVIFTNTIEEAEIRISNTLYTI